MSSDRAQSDARGDPWVAARQLRRRTADRVIAGVASGLGDYLNVDPILVRAAFVGLMIFGGAGLVLYVAGWLLIPAQGQEDSTVETLVRRVAQRTGRFGAALLVLAAIAVASPWITGYGGMFYIQPELFWGLAVVVVGAILIVGRHSRGGERPAHGAAATAGPIVEALSRPIAAPRMRQRSPLGWYVVAVVVLVLGLLAAVDSTAAVELSAAQSFGAAFVVLGLGLVVGAWWGRARLLVLLGIAILPVAAATAFVTVPLEGGIGDHVYRPLTLGELQPAYRIVGGQIWLDLRDLRARSQSVSVALSVGVGSLVVLVPDDARITVDASVDGGQLWLFDGNHTGTGLVDRVERPGLAGGPSLTLTLQAGIGTIRLEPATAGGT